MFKGKVAVGTLLVESCEDETGRFRVFSRRKVYLTDLFAYHGIGWCGCQDFEFNRAKGLDSLTAAPRNPDQFRCKHITAARTALGWAMVDAAANHHKGDQ